MTGETLRVNCPNLGASGGYAVANPATYELVFNVRGADCDVGAAWFTFYDYTTGTPSIYITILQGSSTLGTSDTVQGNGDTTVHWQSAPFPSPIRLLKDAQYTYRISISGGSFAWNQTTVGTTTNTGASGVYFEHVSNTMSDDMAWGFDVVQVNTAPTAPTGVTATSVRQGDLSTVNWQHNDPDGDPQSQYQLRYRKAAV